jgi:hypothetical protein
MTRSPKTGFLLFCGLAAAAALAAHEPEGFSISVLVDGRPAPEYAGRGRVYIEALKGKEFTIRLSNPTSGRVAVALSVDGRNVIDAKRTSDLAATKWILAPGQTADIPGWQVSGETARKFFFTETAKSYAKWLGDTANVGTIEAVFFREKRREPVISWKDEAEKRRDRVESAEADAERGAGAPRPSESSAPRAEGKTAQAPARDADNFAATGIGDRTPFQVQWAAFDEDPTPAARIALRYEFRPELVRLGVYPRQEELFARDHARGFEREYAPDPYRR